MTSRLYLALLLCGLASIAAAAPAKSGKPSDPGSKSADGGKKVEFPAPEVNQILKGWNGLDWGTPLAQFQAKFPKASKNAAGRWSTGAGEEKLGPVAGTTLYGFNKKGELNLIVFEPVEADRALLRDKLIDAGILQEKVNANWQNSGVTFVCTESKVGQFVVIVHAKYADPKPGKT